MQFLPILTTPAGLCLTESNYSDVGIQCLSIHLEALLIRPGLDNIVAWCQRLQKMTRYVLNASMLRFNAQGICTVISATDGRRMTFSEQSINDCLTQLTPDLLIMPETEKSLFYCVIPDLTLQQWQTMLPVEGYVESDAPAEQGRQGWFYSDHTLSFLGDSVHQFALIPLDDSCTCPCCQQGFTRAYLYHLWFHTPLLCQRYLIQHNLFCFKDGISTLAILT